MIAINAKERPAFLANCDLIQPCAASHCRIMPAHERLDHGNYKKPE
jgi:hypothetical protein